MAKIEMDLSEFKLLEENKKLLEDSLQREKALQASINTLNLEKIKALEDAKMKVIKINKSEAHEYIYLRRDPRDILKELHFIYTSDRDGRDRYGDRDRRGLSNPEDMTEHLTRIFFRKEKAVSHSTSPEVTTHGLDEIKAELRADIKNDIDGEIIDKLNRAEAALIRNTVLHQENKTLTSSNTVIESSNKLLADKCEELDKENKDFQKFFQKVSSDTHIVERIKEILTNRYGIWNKAVLLDKILFELKNR